MFYNQSVGAPCLAPMLAIAGNNGGVANVDAKHGVPTVYWSRRTSPEPKMWIFVTGSPR